MVLVKRAVAGLSDGCVTPYLDHLESLGHSSEELLRRNVRAVRDFNISVCTDASSKLLCVADLGTEYFSSYLELFPWHLHKSTSRSYL